MTRESRKRPSRRSDVSAISGGFVRKLIEDARHTEVSAAHAIGISRARAPQVPAIVAGYAQPSDSTSACSRTSCVAFSCLSGGYPRSNRRPWHAWWAGQRPSRSSRCERAARGAGRRQRRLS